MQERLLIRTRADAESSALSPKAAPRLPKRRRVLLSDPAHFRIEYAINPHMQRDGELQRIDPARAREQWVALRDAYKELGVTVEVVEADERFPDLVFAANQAFPFPDPHGLGDGYGFIPAIMAHDQRAGEVPLIADHLKGLGYVPKSLGVNGGTFEGGGDLMWFGESRRVLVGGVGPRTSAKALQAVGEQISAPLVMLDMHDPDFYHLDTCLAFLDDETAMWVPNAFKPAAQELLRSIVDELIVVDDLEARRGLACNVHTPDGRRVLMQQGNPMTSRALDERGYDVIELDTSEFVKAGGSVYCLKMMMW